MRPFALLTLSFLSLCAFAQGDSGTFVPSSPNSIMSGATELVFIADTGKNEVTIKSVRCRPVDKGLSCDAVRRSTNYFLESPEHFFSLEHLTFAEARPIVEAYKAGRIRGLPDWFATGHPNVAAITTLPDGSYRMRFGDVYCTGCTAAYNVRLEASVTEARLVYVGDPEAVCF
jgi:hypothetical protein